MITIIGIIAILFAIAMAIIINVVEIRKEDDEGRGNKKSPKLLREWNLKRSFLTLGVGIVFLLFNGLFFYNAAGTATSIQYPWGGDNVVTTQGIKLKLWGKIIPISFELAMQDVIIKKDADGNYTESLPDEEGIYYRYAPTREFADAIKADIAASLIVSVNYQDEVSFADMADKNRSEQKLVYARVLPVYEQALKNTCKLMDAQDYISGASSQFDYYLKDQMENGMYLTEEVYEDIETVAIGDSTTNRTVAKGNIASKEKREKKYRIRMDENGDPVRDASNSLKRYGLTVQQAAVTNIDWEPSFDTRLDKQKDQVALTQLEKASAEKEFYATQNAIAKGEREKAEVRVKLEKEQLSVTIAAETRAKEASYKEQEQANLLKADEIAAKRIRITADAEAYKIRKNVVAGISPVVRLQMEIDGEVAKEEWKSKKAVPHTVIVSGGDGENGSSISNETLMLMQLTNSNKLNNK